MSRSSAASAHPTIPARLFRSFVILTLVLFVGHLAHVLAGSKQDFASSLLTAAILAGSSIGLALLAKVAWSMHTPLLVRVVLVVALVYHALFGVVMLVIHIRTDATSNDDLVTKLWPHVVHFIHSFE